VGTWPAGPGSRHSPKLGVNHLSPAVLGPVDVRDQSKKAVVGTQTMVAHSYNPSYSGGGEDGGD
jgi:hypothetical protein